MHRVPVVILAGGKGTRLSEYTTKIPKPLVNLNGRPLIYYIINHYVKYGYNDFIICLGYKGIFIKKYFEKLLSSNKKYSKWNIIFANTGIYTSTGTRIKKIKKFIKTDYFLLTYGDGVSRINIKTLVQYHLSSKKVITFTAVRPPARFGEVKFYNDSNKIKSFEEKNKIDAGWINGGFFVINKEFFKYIPSRDVMLEKYPMNKALKLNKMGAFKYSGFWHCVDSKRDLDKLQNIIKKNLQKFE